MTRGRGARSSSSPDRANNGAMGIVAAAELAARGREVSVISLSERDHLQGRGLGARVGNFRCCRSIPRRSASRR